MNHPARRVALASIVVLAFAVLAAPQAEAVSDVVISQVYGGGGNTGSVYRNDFIELFNRGATAVSLNGWSVQYASSSGTSWQRTNLTNVNLQPGQYYLVQEAQGAGGTTNLPTPDATGTIPMSGTAGKVALVSNQTTIGAVSCPGAANGVVDFVGFGTGTNCYEGVVGPTPAPSNSNSVFRGSNGCTDTDNNSADFTAAAAAPRNSASAVNLCAGVTPTISISDVSAAEGNSGTTAFSFQVTLSAGSATFDITTVDGTAKVANSDYAANSATSRAVAAGTPYTFTVLVNGDTTPEPTETFTVVLSNVGAGVTVAKGTGTGTIRNDDPYPVEVFQIQGTGSTSPYEGQLVITTNNVVTAVGPQGFFIQTPTARDDGDPATSNGIYVYTGGAPTVAVGNLVNVNGTVSEYYEFTEISSVTNVTTVSSGNPLPAAIEFGATFPSPDPNAPTCGAGLGLECIEGMLVHVANGITSGPNQRFSSDLSAEIYAVGSTSRPFREKGIKYPGLAGLPVWDGNPEIFEIDADALGLLPNPDYVPAGSTYSATGVMAYEYSGWELWPTAFSFVPPTIPRPVRARNAGEFTVGTYNLLQLDATASNYTTRLQKHSGYIRIVLGAPDVLGVEECMSITELNALAARLHTDDASLNYTAYLSEGHDVGGIDVGFLVRDTVANAVVTQLGYDEKFSVDGSYLHDRPPLLLEANYVGNGAPFAFTVMVNHTRSLNSIDSPTDGDRVRQKRLEQAQSIAQKIQAYQTAHLTRPFVVVGDLNAYEITDGYVDVVGQMAGSFVPADNLLSGPDLVTPDLTKQALNVPANDRYSYNFDGTAQVLDHALTTQATNAWVRGFAYGRGNSDSAEDLLNDGTTFLRASDHDGAVLFLMSDPNGDGVPDDAAAATKTVTGTFGPGGAVTYSITLTNNASTLQPDSAGNELVDVLPSGLALVSATATSGTAVATVATRTVTWNGSIPAHGTVTVTINATVSSSATTGQAFSNQAVYSYDADRNGTNETTTVTDDPVTSAAGDPTTFVVALDANGAVVIPTLDRLGLGLLVALVALGGVLLLGRRLS